MKKKIFLIFAILAFGAVNLCAHPASEVELSYSPSTKTLEIIVAHRSSDQPDHRIRKIIVYQNNDELESFVFPWQTTASSLEKKLSLEAQPGDQIRVKALCSEAGSKEEVLIIPKPPIIGE